MTLLSTINVLQEFQPWQKFRLQYSPRGNHRDVSIHTFHTIKSHTDTAATFAWGYFLACGPGVAGTDLLAALVSFDTTRVRARFSLFSFSFSDFSFCNCCEMFRLTWQSCQQHEEESRSLGRNDKHVFVNIVNIINAAPSQIQP